jgi:hypothetical protein
MRAKRFLMILGGIAFSISVIAQEIPAAQKNLMQFVGKWKSTDIKLTMGGKTYGGEYTFDCSAVNMNTGILAHEHFANEELGHMMGENLLGYDPNLGEVHLYSIDNMGTAHDHYGFWIDDHHLFVQYQGVVEDQMYVEQIDMVFKDQNTMQLNLTAMLNGELFEKAIGTFKK